MTVTTAMAPEMWGYNRQIEELQILALRKLQALSPLFSKDGDSFCYLLGDNLQVGCAGFGKTPWEAAKEFLENYGFAV